MRIAVAAVLAASFWAVPGWAATPAESMVRLMLKGQEVEGTPLAWNTRQVRLLGRDGRLWQFDPGLATEFRQTSSRFHSYSTSELRAILLRSLGQGYEVSGTSHYLVAHPRGERDKWPRRFEDLYRSFVHYFSVRGFELSEPPFPLLGVVCKNKADFHRYAAEQQAAVPAGVVGVYGLISNRIILYDMQGRKDSKSWQENASAIIHEVTHQTAFNMGIHSRYTPPPLWVAEGLATMFEARGVYDSRHWTRRSDRINRGRLQSFQSRVEPNHRPGSLEAMIASDQPFQADPVEAYAEAWALSFYLIETQPRKYASYLSLTAGHPAFTEYTPKQRIADFQSVFGSDWRMLQARFLRFLGGMK
ncbi:MAG: DUF1570 domain-containing protein [Planctomycetota bacterium]